MRIFVTVLAAIYILLNAPHAGAVPHHRRAPTLPYEVAERMCAASRHDSRQLTVTHWSEWLNPRSTRHIRALQALTRLQRISDIENALVYGNCPSHQGDDSLPLPLAQLSPSPTDTQPTGPATNTDSNSPFTAPSPARAAIPSRHERTHRCNTLIIEFEAQFRASDWCGVTASERIPPYYLDGTMRIIDTRPAYRARPPQR